MAKPMGRPSKYKPEFCQEIVPHLGSGGSVEGFCAKHKVHKDTFYSWLEAHQEFNDAFIEAKQKQLEYWLALGRNALVNGENFNTPLYKYLMWLFCGVKETQEVKQTIDAKVENVDATKKIEDKLNGLLAEIQSRKSK